MRELKFRYWKEEDKRMFQLDSSTYINHNGKIEEVWIAYEDSFEYDYPIMQWTGLKDINGVDIYEGDILSNGINCSGTVRFINGMYLVDFIYTEDPPLSHDKEEHTFRLITVASITEIIGNIYQNPELL